jgi:hypothetical protein
MSLLNFLSGVFLLIILGSFLIYCCFRTFTLLRLVDWRARCETPAGSAGQVRPRHREAIRRLTARPAESEHPGAEINPFKLQQSLRKQPYFKNNKKQALKRACSYNHVRLCFLNVSSLSSTSTLLNIKSYFLAFV